MLIQTCFHFFTFMCINQCQFLLVCVSVNPIYSAKFCLPFSKKTFHFAIITHKKIGFEFPVIFLRWTCFNTSFIFCSRCVYIISSSNFSCVRYQTNSSMITFLAQLFFCNSITVNLRKSYGDSHLYIPPW